MGCLFRASREWAGNGAGRSNLQAAPKRSHLDASWAAGAMGFASEQNQDGWREPPTNLRWVNLTFPDANGRRSGRFRPRVLSSVAL